MEKHCCEIPVNSMPLVVEADHGLAVRPMIHCDRTADFHVMIYLLEGGMEIIEDGITCELAPGTLFFLKKGVHHWGEKPFLTGSAWYYAHFRTEEITSAMQPYTKLSQTGEKVYLTGTENQTYLTLPKIQQISFKETLKDDFENMITVHNSGKMVETSLLLWKILLRAADQVDGSKTERDSRVEMILQFLQAHQTGDFTAKELEKAVQLSYKYAGTLFKKHMGMTMGEYVTDLKIKKAEQLLCGSKKTLAEIAAETGFYDAFYFSRIFKREKGISPSEFRQTYIPRI